MYLPWLCILQGFVAAALEHFWSSGVKDDKQLLAGGVSSLWVAVSLFHT
jgi:hypothetical protein